MRSLFRYISCHGGHSSFKTIVLWIPPFKLLAWMGKSAEIEPCIARLSLCPTTNQISLFNHTLQRPRRTTVCLWWAYNIYIYICIHSTWNAQKLSLAKIPHLYMQWALPTIQKSSEHLLSCINQTNIFGIPWMNHHLQKNYKLSKYGLSIIISRFMPQQPLCTALCP